MNKLTFDFETTSECELKKSGAYKYSIHPTTRATCLSIKPHGKQIRFLDYYEVGKLWKTHKKEFKTWWENLIEEGYLFSGHNVFFDRCIYENVLVKRLGWPKIPRKLFRCTAAKAAACALPRNLAGAGEALGLSVQKDPRGFAAMHATCKPTKQWKAWEKKGKAGTEPLKFITPHDAPQIFETLYEYCKIDTKAEECLDEALPDLIPEEQEVWFFNQKINWRGIRIDMPTVKKIVGIMEIESKKKLKELDTLTMGLVTKPGSRKSILEFLEIEGVKLPNLQKGTVEDKLLGYELSEDARHLLEIRKALSLASTKKYQSFLNRVSEDGYGRDIQMYHGAGTGRDTGVGFQIHNFPKPLIFVDENRPYAAIENVIECDVEMLKLIYGDNLSILFSSILRNMVIPSEGCEFFVGDFSMIEVAVLWWLADNLPGLRVLREGKDPYLYQAASNAGKNYEDFTKKSPERVLGKAQTLGAGFGMGWEKFQITAQSMYKLTLTEDQSREAIGNYRRVNAAVPELWKAYEKAAVDAVESPGRIFHTGKCDFKVYNGFLWVKLPSGRRLAYRKPQIAWRETEYGPRKTLEFWGVNPKTKKWSIERTWGGTFAENITQAVARDLLMHAMLRLEKARYRGVFSVHDEGVNERKIGEGNLEEYLRIFCEVPSWAKGCPIKAEGWVGPRYRK